MSLTSWLLVPFLLILPLGLSWQRRDESPMTRALCRRLAVRTGAAVGLMLLLAGIEALGGFDWWYALPFFMTFHRPPAELTWILSFWLWSLSARILHGHQPSSPADSSPGPAPILRAASLTSRRARSPLPAWSWALLWLPWLVASAWLAAVWTDTPSQLRLITLLILAAQIPGLTIALWTPTLALREPEPLDPSGRNDLEEAYSRYRRRRLVGLFVLAAVMSCAVSGIAVCVLLQLFDEQSLGLVGGLGGSLIGVAGAGFGIWNGTERLRIQRRVESGRLEPANRPDITIEAGPTTGLR